MLYLVDFRAYLYDPSASRFACPLDPGFRRNDGDGSRGWAWVNRFAGLDNVNRDGH